MREFFLIYLVCKWFCVRVKWWFLFFFKYKIFNKRWLNERNVKDKNLLKFSIIWDKVLRNWFGGKERKFD